MALVAVLPADDHELLPLDAFDLEPILGPLAVVGALAFFEMIPSPPSLQMASNSFSPLPTTWSP